MISLKDYLEMQETFESDPNHKTDYGPVTYTVTDETHSQTFDWEDFKKYCSENPQTLVKHTKGYYDKKAKKLDYKIVIMRRLWDEKEREFYQKCLNIEKAIEELKLFYENEVEQTIVNNAVKQYISNTLYATKLPENINTLKNLINQNIMAITIGSKLDNDELEELKKHTKKVIIHDQKIIEHELKMLKDHNNTIWQTEYRTNTLNE